MREITWPVGTHGSCVLGADEITHKKDIMPCGVGRGLTRNPRNTQNPYGVGNCLTQMAQTFAEACGAKFLCISVQRFLTQEQKDITLCVPLRLCVRRFFTQNWRKSLSELVRGKQSRKTQKSLHVFARIYSYFFWATNGHEFALMQPRKALV